MDMFQKLSAYRIGSLWTISLPVILILLTTKTQHVDAVLTNCSDAYPDRPSGTIRSPNYPLKYPNDAKCKWHIPITDIEVATIRFSFIAIEFSRGCKNDYVSIGPNNTLYCGTDLPVTYISELNADPVLIIFWSNLIINRNGFVLEYFIGDRYSSSCEPLQFHCGHRNCIPLEWKCDGRVDCYDASDESDITCPAGVTTGPMTTVPANCPSHQILCQSVTTNKPICLAEQKKCDGHTDCADAQDERDCTSICNKYINGNSGNFTSPNFPKNYDKNLDCFWVLTVMEGAIIQLRFYTFNLEQGFDTDYVNVYDSEVESSEFLLGTFYSYNHDIHVPPKVIEGSGNKLKVVFHTDASSNNLGFNATFQTKGLCILNQTHCSSTDKNCYDQSQRCDKYMTCLKGEDELGCENCKSNQIPCSRSRTGCFTKDQRCDGKHNCQLGEDEQGCDGSICNTNHGLFLCGDGKCMEEKYICDSSSDCIDESDETNCYVSTNVITAAAVGSIVCGLLLVAALSCTCKLYQLHVRDRFPPSHMSPLREIEEELLRREAPPSYTATMASPHFDEAQRAFIEGIQAAVIARNESRGPSRQSGSRRQRSTFVRMLSRDRSSRSGSQSQIEADENTTESQTETLPPSPAEVENDVDTMTPQEESILVENGPPPLRRISAERTAPSVVPSPVEALPQSSAVQQESASSSVSDTDSETNQDALRLVERDHQILRATANIRRMRLAGGLQNVMQAQDHRAARSRSRSGSQADTNPTTSESAQSGDSAPTSDYEEEMVAAVGSSSQLNENTNNTLERTETENPSLPPEPTQEAFDMPESSLDHAQHAREESELELDSETLPQDGDAQAGRDSNEEEKLSQASSILSLEYAGSDATGSEDVSLVEP